MIHELTCTALGQQEYCWAVVWFHVVCSQQSQLNQAGQDQEQQVPPLAAGTNTTVTHRGEYQNIIILISKESSWCVCVCVYLPGSNALISRTQPPHCPDHCWRSEVPHPSSGPCVYGERGQLQKETTVHIILIRRNPSANPFTLQDERTCRRCCILQCFCSWPHPTVKPQTL